jgi:hypothetical protein
VSCVLAVGIRVMVVAHVVSVADHILI